MVDIPTIEPFQFIRSTAFSERVQLANKLNEVIDALNQIGTIDDLQTQIDAINSEISEIHAALLNTNSDVSTLSNQLNGLISEVNTTVKQSISALESEVDGIDTRLTTAEGTISEHGTEIDGLLNEVIDSVAITSDPHGTVRVQINHEDGSNDISAPIDLGLVEEGGITLQSGTTDRSFKLIVTLTDGTSWQTNDFVIPEGGGTEVSVTNISIAQGTGTDKIQVKIGLSDGSTISSNDWTVVTPTEFAALGTRVTTAEGNITKNTGDISDLDTRVQTLEDSPGYALQPATATTLGGVKIGAGIVVQSDGTISVDKTQINTAAVASTVMFTADTSKVTLHADSIAGSEFTEDIPQASQGGAGTIDHASYAKIAATESKVNALAPTVSVNEDVTPPTITVGVNGKNSTANLPLPTISFTPKKFKAPTQISASVFDELFNDLLTNQGRLFAITVNTVSGSNFSHASAFGVATDNEFRPSSFGTDYRVVAVMGSVTEQGNVADFAIGFYTPTSNNERSEGLILYYATANSTNISMKQISDTTTGTITWVIL